MSCLKSLNLINYIRYQRLFVNVYKISVTIFTGWRIDEKAPAVWEDWNALMGSSFVKYGIKMGGTESLK